MGLGLLDPNQVVGVVHCTVVGGCVLGRGDGADVAVEAGGVVSVDPAEGGEFDVLDGLPASLAATANELGLVKPVEGLGQGVVVGMADAADRGRRPQFGEALAVANAGELPWLPASECATSPSRCVPRDQRAISKASRTISVRMFVATRQPTIMRLGVVDP
jgi:hypothetical protein